ncbi:MAG TPA: SH3 domain-containing protein [Treponemataceae bacterium]|nr:SH3 domain-containing protein [Treponemataceae bacterium]
MKKHVSIVLIFLFLLPCVFAKAGDTMYVNVKESILKSGTGFFASKLGTVYYGDTVIILAEAGKWTQIELKENPSNKGWIPSTNLTKKKIISGKTQNLSESELALAGKGFSAEVEDAMKQRHGELRFDLVDKIENNYVGDEDLLEFIVEGKLYGGEG